MNRINRCHHFKRSLNSLEKARIVLGIETSCDDTAVAIVNSEKKILATRNYSKKDVQVKLGGICPDVTAQIHRNFIDKAVNECVQEANLRFSDLDAIACTTRPGLVMCLKVGANKGVQLAQKYKLPLIPVHHMRAHSLSAGLDKDVHLRYPFVTILISGGHALIAIAKSPSDFDLIGETENGSPGECLDKIGRALKITKMPEFDKIHPGAAIEMLASEAKGEQDYFEYVVKFPSTGGPNFHFTNLKGSFLTMIKQLDTDSINLVSMCASVQFTVTAHLCQKVHLALETLRFRGTDANQIVVSGGVASNQFIKNALSKVAKHHKFELIVPPKHLCTDNGEMIAWAGLEILRIQDNASIINNIHNYIFVNDKELIGKDLTKNWGPPKPVKRIVLRSLLPFYDSLIVKNIHAV
uniref:N(6)-L-threonylcarbamoyladenine synthase n=1 Tax=Rhabditophanes sp. KR3021 TaxID=114890 RepID=A0AC35TGJ4_9BILA